MNYQLDPNVMQVQITGTLNYNAQGTLHSQPVNYRSTFHVDSKVNLTTQPPVFVPKQQR